MPRLESVLFGPVDQVKHTSKSQGSLLSRYYYQDQLCLSSVSIAYADPRVAGSEPNPADHQVLAHEAATILLKVACGSPRNRRVSVVATIRLFPERRDGIYTSAQIFLAGHKAIGYLHVRVYLRAQGLEDKVAGRD